VKTILAAIDFSEVTEHVVGRSALLAEALGSRLWLVHVAAPDPDFAGYDAGPDVVRDQVAKHLREEHRALQTMAEELRGRGIDTTALLVQGATVATILQEATKLEADLIVVGSHGRGAISRALLGSTSEGVLHKAVVPVLIVPTRTTPS
jgi:nucleotide-binding universal stress UspA family protein